MGYYFGVPLVLVGTVINLMAFFKGGEVQLFVFFGMMLNIGGLICCLIAGATDHIIKKMEELNQPVSQNKN